MVSRRRVLKVLAAGVVGAALGSTARSYARILGANDRLTFGIIGLHGRAYAHLASVRANRGMEVSHVCDVDSRELDKFAVAVKEKFGRNPVCEKDFRKVLESRDGAERALGLWGRFACAKNSKRASAA